MTGEKEFRELAANSEALELVVKFGLGIYRGYDSCRGEFTEVFTNHANTHWESLTSNTTKTTPPLSKQPAAQSAALLLKLKRQRHDLRRNTLCLERPGG